MRSRRWATFAAVLVVVLVPAGSRPPGTRTLEPVTAASPPASSFAGTPAHTFLTGAAGIVLPEPEAVPDGYRINHLGEMRDIPAEEVDEALERLRAALVAARLDTPMLVHHSPEPYIATLAPTYGTSWLHPLPWTRDWYASPEFANHATMLDPGMSLAAPSRVRGRITLRAGTDDWGMRGRDDPISVLEMVTRFVWVYAFEVPADEPGGGIVVVREEAVWLVPTDYRTRFHWLDQDPNDGIHRGRAEARAWGADCELYVKEGHLRPDGGFDLPAVVFDIDQPLEPVPGCRPNDFDHSR